MPVGGDILEISWNHPTLGSGKFNPKAAEDSVLDLGGFVASDDANMIDGGGNMIDQINQKRWRLECTAAVDTNIDLTLEKLQALQADPETATWTISHINGSVYSGKGKPVGDLAANWNNTTCKVTLAGGKKLKKII